MTGRNRDARTTLGPVLAVAVVLSLGLVLLPSGLTSATPAPTASTSETLWAYGAVETVDYAGTSHLWQYSATATYGYSVILNQTNLTATTFELDANRTMGVLAQIHYCYPSCTNPTYYGNESVHVYETVTAAADLTTAGSVNENGTSVPAIALNSSETHLRANYTEASSSYRPILGVVGNRSTYLSASVLGMSNVQLHPGLGLLPLSLSSAQNWNSSSAFDANVSANYQWYAAASGPRGSGHLGPVTGNFSSPRNGTVDLYGSYNPSDSVVLGGVAYPELALRIVGPFSVREGFILLPAPADLFSGTTTPWSSLQNDSATASMSYLDARAIENGHLGFGASQWVYGASTLNPSSVAPTGASGGLSPDLGGVTDASPVTTVQGEPEAVGTAQQQQGCLLSGSGCPAATTGPAAANLRGLVGLVAIGAVVLVVVLVAVLVAERRRIPPPAYPNAALYPPGAAPAAPRAPAPEPAPAEDDPLRNLW